MGSLDNCRYLAYFSCRNSVTAVSAKRYSSYIPSFPVPVRPDHLLVPLLLCSSQYQLQYCCAAEYEQKFGVKLATSAQISFLSSLMLAKRDFRQFLFSLYNDADDKLNTMIKKTKNGIILVMVCYLFYLFNVNSLLFIIRSVFLIMYNDGIYILALRPQ